MYAQPQPYQPQQPYYPPPQQDYYNQNMNYYQQPQPVQMMPQQVYISPQPTMPMSQPMSQPIYMPPPQIIEPIIIQPQSQPGQIVIKDLDRRDYCTQDMKTWTKSRLSQEIYCKYCKKVIQSRVKYEFGVGSCFMMFMFCCLPLCLDSMKDVHHVCPCCRQKCGYSKYLC